MGSARLELRADLRWRRPLSDRTTVDRTPDESTRDRRSRPHSSHEIGDRSLLVCRTNPWPMAILRKFL